MERVGWLALFLLAGCQAPAPSWSGNERVLHATAEALAGARAAPALEARFGGIVPDVAAEWRMTRIGAGLLGPGSGGAGGAESGGDSAVVVHYRLLASDALNALSLPGGRIYITRGLYARLSSDDCLAAVLAHEMAHLQAKDHFKPLCASAKASLTREIHADQSAANRLVAAGFRRSAMKEVIEMVRLELPSGSPEIRTTSLATKVTEPAPLPIPGPTHEDRGSQ